MNEYRNQLWWNSHDCPFLVSMKKKIRTGRNLPKKCQKLAWMYTETRFGENFIINASGFLQMKKPALVKIYQKSVMEIHLLIDN